LTDPKAARVYRSEALVLKAYDYGEADRILTLYTPQHGKLRAIAKGVRRPKSRMTGHLDLFTRSHLLVAHGRQLDIITQAETIESFRPMRDDLLRLTYAHYVAELLEAFTAEQLANYPLYSLAVATLRRLASAGSLDLAVRSFEMQLLALTGYRPQLRSCLNCDAAIAPGVNRFSAKMGGILCPNCAAADTASVPISIDALKVLRNLQSNEEAVLSLRNLPEPIRGEVEQRLQDYVTYRMEARPRSTRFLNQVRAEANGPPQSQS
jgi:DNA repair protein RecO (recombination protein O)